MLLGELLCMYCVQHGHHGPLITAGGDVRAGVVDALEPLIQLLQLTAHHLRQGAELGLAIKASNPNFVPATLLMIFWASFRRVSCTFNSSFSCCSESFWRIFNSAADTLVSTTDMVS